MVDVLGIKQQTNEPMIEFLEDLEELKGNLACNYLRLNVPLLP